MRLPGRFPGSTFPFEVLTHSPDMLGVYTPDGIILWLSSESETIHGYPAEELVGRHAYEFVHPEDLALVKAVHQRAFDAPEKADAVFRVMHRDGSIRWVHVRGRAVRIGDEDEPVCMICTARDVTSSQEREQDAARTGQLSLLLMEHLPAAAFVISLDDRYEYVNPHWERKTGIPKEQARGKTFSDIWPPEVAAIFKDLGEQVRRKGDVVDVEVDLNVAAGRRRFHSVRFPLVDETGALTATAGFSMDVTAARELEVRQQEQQKLEAIARLAGGIAHEFNNALTVLQGYAELIQQPFTTMDQARRHAAAIESTAQQSAELVRQLLIFARRTAYTPSRMNLGLALRAMEAPLRQQLESRVTLRVDAAPVEIHADPELIQVILRAFASYALKAMPGGGTLTLRTAAGPQGAVLTADDTSAGLTPEQRVLLFEPFDHLRVGQEPLTASLSSAYGAIQQMGGSIDVESPAGGGVRFTVRFPLPPDD